MAQNNSDQGSVRASEMQQANAAGANQNEQGQASFTTGSTTGGGSDFGQGSSQLGAESYRQGSTANEGANYNNEEGRLGASSVGTSNEGSSSQVAGAAESGGDSVQSVSGSLNHDRNTLGADARQTKHSDETPKEGERRDTSLEEDTHMDIDNTTASRRTQAGSWSASSNVSDNE